MDTIFANLNAPPSLGDEDYSVEDYESDVRSMIEDARSFNDENSAPYRELMAAYYAALEPHLDEEGRSTIVATEVRDLVMAMLPSLMRIFTGAEHVVEYLPRTEKDVPMAAQATDYINYVFWEDNPGFLTLHSLLKDALIKGMGIATWWTDVSEEVSVKEFTGLDAEQMALIPDLFPQYEEINREEYQVPIEAPDDVGHLQVNYETLYDLSIRYTKKSPKHKVMAIAPDAFRVDRNAKEIDCADLVGWEDLVPSSKLVAMGYDRALVEQFKGSTASIRWNEERSIRNPGLDMSGAGRSGRNDYVLYGEYYVRVDKDDDGVAELRKICTMGDGSDIVKDDPVDRVKLAFFCPDPEPHTVVGHASAEQATDIQKIKSSMLRAILDSLAQTIWPRLGIDEQRANLDDVLNNEIGAPIRTKGPPSEVIQQIATTFVGDPAFNMLSYIDLLAQKRTGITEASKGLDPKALQSTNIKGIDMVITGAQERIELVARILCETGYKTLFKGLLQEVVENPAKDRVVRLRDTWVTIQPDQFDATMDVRTNPAIGRGSDMDRLNTLMVVKQTQELIMSTQGIDNPVVGPEEYRNTLADILAIANIKNVDRYYKPITPEVKQQIAQSSANKPPSPEQIIANAEVEKIKAKTASDLGKLQETQRKNSMDEDFRRDKMETDAAIQMAKIHSSGEQASNVATIREVNATDRLSRQLSHDATQSERQHQVTQQENAADRQVTQQDNEANRQQNDEFDQRKALVDIGNAELDRAHAREIQLNDQRHSAAQAALDRSATAIEAARNRKVKTNGPR